MIQKSGAEDVAEGGGRRVLKGGHEEGNARLNEVRGGGVVLPLLLGKVREGVIDGGIVDPRGRVTEQQSIGCRYFGIAENEGECFSAQKTIGVMTANIRGRNIAKGANICRHLRWQTTLSCSSAL